MRVISMQDGSITLLFQAEGNYLANILKRLIECFAVSITGIKKRAFHNIKTILITLNDDRNSWPPR